MSYDPTRGRVVIFGGRNNALAPLGDTWEWDGDAWTQVADTGPSARPGPGMCFNRIAQRTILFGGSGQSDTWSWNGSDWTQINDVGPAPCESPGMVGAGNGVVLFGGVDPATNPITAFGLTWELSGSEWTERQDLGPSPRFYHGMALDTDRGALILFGGGRALPGQATANDLFNDTWEASIEDGNGGPGDQSLFTLTANPITVPLGQTIFIGITIKVVAPVTTAVILEVAQGGQPFVAIVNATLPAGAASIVATTRVPAGSPKGKYEIREVGLVGTGAFVTVT